MKLQHTVSEGNQGLEACLFTQHGAEKDITAGGKKGNLRLPEGKESAQNDA